MPPNSYAELGFPNLSAVSVGVPLATALLLFPELSNEFPVKGKSKTGTH